ncbi:MAG: transglutaminase-like domain-containing protein [Gammaproteobacteria bacterium]|nr:transglutaminase-like domain-containing protein [Gammaproteobacteria bacterium]
MNLQKTLFNNHAQKIHIIVVILLIMGTISILLRWGLTGENGLHQEDSIWNLTIQTQFNATDKAVTVVHALPKDTRYARVVAQNVFHPGLKIRRAETKNVLNRELVAKTNKKGTVKLITEFIIQVSKDAYKKSPVKPASLTIEDRDKYLLPEEETVNIQILALIEELTKNSADKQQLLDNIFNYTHNKLITDKKLKNDTLLHIIKTKHTTPRGRARLLIALSRAAKYPSRIVTGFRLEESSYSPPHFWVEIYDEDKWIPYDPENGYKNQLPPNYIPVKRGDENIITLSETVKTNITYKIKYDYEYREQLSLHDKSLFDVIDLTRLPISMQNTLFILLLFPLGALINTFFRQVIGIRTYGAFTPSLLALSAIYSDWITALVLAAVVGSIALTGRSFIPGKPERMSRLTMVITLVIFGMILSVSIMEYFQLQTEGQIVLVPMVIMTMLVDRFYTVLDESGAHIAITRLYWTITVAVISFFLFQMDFLGYFLLKYPEFHLFTLSSALLLSVYKGKKLSNLELFKWIRESIVKDPSQDLKNNSTADKT